MFLEFLRRAVWAIFGVPALMILAYLGGWWLFVPLAGLTLVGLAEYYSAALGGGFRPAVGLGFIVGLAVIAAAVFTPAYAAIITIGLLAVLAGGALISVLRPGFKQVAVTSSAITVFGVVYVAVMLSFLVHLRQMDLPLLIGAGSIGQFWHRTGAVVLVIVPVWFCDTFAFVAGKTWGQRPLAPAISPRKTVEGAVAGLLSALLATVGLGAWMEMPWYHAVILGVLMGSLGQIGDLSSSILKRNLEMDDFGTVFGIHGGFLDRFDAMLFNLPLAYYYLQIVFVLAK